MYLGYYVGQWFAVRSNPVGPHLANIRGNCYREKCIRGADLAPLPGTGERARIALFC